MLKGKCIDCSDKGFATIVFNKDKPKINTEYLLEDLSEGTNAQNKLFHEILKQFYWWMFKNDTFIIEDNDIVYNLTSADPDELKDIMKARYGRKWSNINYVNDKLEMVSIPKKKPKNWKGVYNPISLIPDYVWKDFNNGNKKRIKQVLISWGDYNKDQRRELLDITLLIMDKFGVDSNDYIELREELDKKSDKYLNKLRKKFL